MSQDAPDYQVELTVDGRPLPLAPFVRQIIASTVFGLVGALKGGENAREVRLTLRRGGPASK
jgi:CRISPR/Cas system-associated exonuclease Cas4 (RecB family)